MTNWKDVRRDAATLLKPDEDLTEIGIEQREMLIKNIDMICCDLITYRMNYVNRRPDNVCPI